ncbi:MAG TPA: hypothetical protein VH081_03420, partial [Solirubrobacteraceae bacterium]|nr:hypothetical protein [Solirubrobacteraceae bacterium]
MRRPLARRHRRRRTSLGAALLTLAVVALVLVAVLAGAGGTQRAAGQIAPGEPTPQSDASVPAQRVTIFGASPVEAANETWGIGDSNQGNGGSSATIVRYSSSGWTIGASLLNHAGEPLSGFAPASSTSGDTYPLAGEMTPDGSGALLGASQGGANEMLLVRDPGGSFQQTTPLPAPEAGEHALLQLEEKLYGGLRAPLLAALEEANGHAGALVVPVRSGGGTSDDGVLHWDGSSWTREPIEIPTAAKAGFHVLAIGASSPTNAWLLAELSSEAYPSGAVALFRRRLGESGETTRWQPVALKAGATPHEAFPLTVPL